MKATHGIPDELLVITVAHPSGNKVTNCWLAAAHKRDSEYLKSNGEMTISLRRYIQAILSDLVDADDNSLILAYTSARDYPDGSGLSARFI